MRIDSLKTSLLAVIIAQAMPMPVPAAAASVPRADGAELDLVVTAAVDNGNPQQCGTSSEVTALRGQAVNLCYTVTNAGSQTLNFHTIVDSAQGRVLVHEPHALAPGASHQFNRYVTAGQIDSTYTAQWVSSDILPGFVVAPTDYDFVDISGTGVVDFSLTFNMPFPIRFLDDTDTQTMCLVDTGALQFFPGLQGPFGICGIWTMHDNVPLPVDFLDGSSPDSIDESNRYPILWMSVFWDYMSDFFTGTAGGAMYRQTIGTAPNRRLVAQWSGFHHLDSDEFTPGDVTFEAIIEEETGRIVMQYQDTTFDDPEHSEWDHGGTASVGYQYGMDLFDDYLNNEPSIADGTAIAWTPNDARIVRSAVASATVRVGDARIELTPTEIDRQVEQGEIVSADISIGNTGTLGLAWSIDEASGRSRILPEPRPRWRPERISTPPTAWLPLHPTASLLHGGSIRDVPVVVPAGTSPLAYAMSYTNLMDGTILYDYKLMPEVAQPDSTINVTDTGAVTWIAAGFVDNDFSREFAISYPDNRLQAVDTRDGAVDDYGAIVGGSQVVQWSSLKWDATTDTTFAMGIDANGASYLYRLDLGNGSVDLVGQIVSGVASNTVITDIAIDANGAMYGIDIAYDGLFAIDKATGDATPIGPIGYDANYLQSMDFDQATGTLYLAGFDLIGGGVMYTVNPTTGAATRLAPLQGLQSVWGFAVATFKGACATPESVPWLSVSPTSGTTAPGDTSTVTVTLDSTSLANGTYEAAVCVHGSDPSDPGGVASVHFFVASDPIFADGFDGP